MPSFGEIEVPILYTDTYTRCPSYTHSLDERCSAWHPLIQVGIRLKSTVIYAYVLEDLKVLGSGKKDHLNNFQRSKYWIR